ncbi:MAG: hypothetical protein ACK41P_02830 [Asticcacaulis sp.]
MKMKIIYILVLSLALMSCTDSAAFKGPVKKFGNVCISEVEGMEYDYKLVIDFFMVDVSKEGKSIASVYIGGYPQLEGVNVKYDTSDYRSKYKNGDLMKLSPPQQGEYLGVPANKDGEFNDSGPNYFYHVMPSEKIYIDKILNGINFC